ncbi:hypothetical protein FH972_006251 [Carpinus fangiana]|uniref:Uncharacterized protein n=1 Tax=Carpinus fangiana TaxID=176857 RepID=A0A5N6QRQ9_9ROSI|nr:hypothetical protein FH972_006251 [Carpinus fangiana]
MSAESEIYNKIKPFENGKGDTVHDGVDSHETVDNGSYEDTSENSQKTTRGCQSRNWVVAGNNSWEWQLEKAREWRSKAVVIATRGGKGMSVAGASGGWQWQLEECQRTTVEINDNNGCQRRIKVATRGGKGMSVAGASGGWQWQLEECRRTTVEINDKNGCQRRIKVVAGNGG